MIPGLSLPGVDPVAVLPVWAAVPDPSDGYPDPADVREGVEYGGLNEYVGEMTATGTGTVYLRRR